MSTTVARNTAAALALVQAAIEARVEDVLQLTTAEATWWIGGTTPWSGTHRIRDLFAKTRVLFADAIGPFTGGVGRVVADSDCVVVESWGHVKLADGRVYHNEVVLLLGFVDGKIGSIKEYGDTELLLRLFGPRLGSDRSR